MSTIRTVGKPTLLVLLLLPAAACDDGDAPASTPATTTPTTGPVPTLPDDVAPGTGVLVLDGDLVALAVTACGTEAVTDTATGVTTLLTAAADDGTSTVDVIRSVFTADATTVTDTVRVSEGGTVLESSRAAVGTRHIDLRQPNPLGPLLELSDDGPAPVVRASGVFGPLGGLADDPANVDGELVLRCP